MSRTKWIAAPNQHFQSQHFSKKITEKEFYNNQHFQSHNWKHDDGHIHATPENEKNTYAYYISPYYKNFQSQVEEGVWPIVSILVNKGYLTLCSCEGHGDRDPYYVTLAFGDKEILNNFIIHLKSKVIKGLDWSIRDTIEDTSTLERYDDTFFRKMEIKNFNYLFLRNYLNYKFLTITLFDQTNIPRCRWIKFLKSNKDKKKYLKQSITQLEELFKKLENVYV